MMTTTAAKHGMPAATAIAITLDSVSLPGTDTVLDLLTVKLE